MRNKLKSSALAILLTLTIMLSACGPLDTFRSTLTGTKTFVQTLVPDVITQAKADRVNQGIDEGAGVINTTETCLKAVSGDKQQKRAGKAQCYLNAGVRLRSILSEHGISGNPQLNRVAVIIQAVISAFEVYARSVSNSGDAESSVASDPDKAVEDALNKADRELKGLRK